MCEIMFDEGLLASYLFCETCLPVYYPHIIHVTLVTEHGDVILDLPWVQFQGQDACRRQALILSHRYVGQNCLYNYIMYTKRITTNKLLTSVVLSFIKFNISCLPLTLYILN